VLHRIVISLVILFGTSLFAQTFGEFVQRLERLPLPQRSAAVEGFFSRHPSTPFIEEDSLLHFVFFGKAVSVKVTGDLQQWNTSDVLKTIGCGDSSFFYRSFTVPSNARFDYQLVVDGIYQLDPRNPSRTLSGYGLHSEVRMPKFASSPYLQHRDTVPHGTIITLKLHDHILPPLRRYTIAGRKVLIYLPPGYDTLSHLSSVYVHNGSEAIDFAKMPTIIDNLIAERKIQPVIAVLIPPAGNKDEYIRDHRDRFVRFLCDELVRTIDNRYKTDRSALKRAMIGISSGGHISLFTVISRPDIFQNVGGQSSTITPQLRELTQKRAEGNTFSLSMKIYLDCGRFDINNDLGDFLQLNRNYSDLLSSLRIPHYYREVNDGHQWASWRERIPDMLVYFFGQ
jgi:enterochelin esterase-like enzyme